jgi:hypothetical protein
MTTRRNLRRPETRMHTGELTSLADRFLDLVEMFSGIGQMILRIICFLIIATILCAVIMAAPDLIADFIIKISPAVAAAAQSVINNPLLLITYPLALFLTLLIVWVPGALENRRSTTPERGRQVLTAAAAKREASRQFDRKNESPRKTRLQ